MTCSSGKTYKQHLTKTNMNFIKKIFDGEIDETVHLQFQKFSKGEFRNRALINAKKSGKKYTIRTTAEFANGLVKIVAEKLGSQKTLVAGAIVSTSDLKEELNPKEIKQFQGVKRYLIEKEMSGEEILELLEKLPKAFFALTFSYGEYNLKIKPKIPKSGKPGKKNEKPKVNFCTLKTTDSEITRDFIFEKPDFKKAEINHTFFIEEIIKPEGETDFVKIRKLAKKKGHIIREAVIDDETINSKKEFVV
ncbi:MAG: hypothetical protein IIA85_02780 [Nanoarchaeota archaeon]|nr:hypothetical protein [Nanoarchaeota archaeon]